MTDKKQNRMRLEKKRAKQAERRRPHHDKYADQAKPRKEASDERR